MSLRLIQARSRTGERMVVADREAVGAVRLSDVSSVYELARRALYEGVGLATMIEGLVGGEEVDLQALATEGRLLPPIDHPDAAHVMVSGTGLTHLGSAEGRDRMHRSIEAGEPLTDSMKMFRLGLEGGKPTAGQTGVQPEWFYKGDGSIVAAPGEELSLPSFALDGGEEAEIVGVYVIADDGTPVRLGFALGNEFSDHVTERQNYLYLAHSKLRACSFGPELLVGELPGDVRGRVRILRDGEVLWDSPFSSGEDNMSHSIANLEAHHFKYAAHRVPGDVHVHFFGTATLSFAEGVRTRPGDVFELQADPFGLPLSNRIVQTDGLAPPVRML
ncbi:MAG: GguC family protein [Acidihalobacter sp.]|uniref:AraD1 family protein n=1 Tax=Acidihalobacter sp. TaxID=1872108 RepID=UPI00307F97C8